MTQIPRIKTRLLGLGFAVLCVLTYCLIVFGATVRAKDAGLSCPDWPLCFGELIPQFNVKVAFEWGHRLLAGIVSVGLALFSVLSLAQPALRSLMKPRLVIAWTLLLVQIVFGGLTVLLKLAPWTVSAHLILGNSFCLTLLWIACDLHAQAKSEAGVSRAVSRLVVSPAVRAFAGLSALCLFLQFVLGGLVSGHYAGLACRTFPTCNGDQIIPEFAGLIGLHVLHRLNGFLLLASFFVLMLLTRKLERIGMLASAAFRIVFLQIFIGIGNVLLKLPLELTALHTAFAAALALVTALLIREVVSAQPEMTSKTSGRMVEVSS